MIDTDLNSDTFIVYAIKNYYCNFHLSEFKSDLKLIKYIKRLIRRYKKINDLQERLILNHIILLSNCFGVKASVRILFYKLDSKYYDVLTPFLLYLNYIDDNIHGINGKEIKIKEIELDQEVIKRLKEL